jgi:oxygen-independent coproporphyrinogen-3 oxidase
LIEKYIKAMKNEIKYRKNTFLFPVETIYFGGGTPSLLNISHFEELLSEVYLNFNILPDPEITCECNPDDLSFEYLKNLKKTGINRLSIGIQSLSDKDLQIMGRRHTAFEAVKAIENSIKAGFENIGVDLIYGLPWSSRKRFAENLKKVAGMPVQHLSAYHLTIEKGTLFSKIFSKEMEEKESLYQYLHLCETMNKHGMVHYEVSNFCKPDLFSRHNSAYWHGCPYWGIGAGAHSYCNGKRYWNKQDIDLYISENFNLLREEETLSKADLFNEQIMLGLRTDKGIDLTKTVTGFSEYYENFKTVADKWQGKGVLYIENEHLKCYEEKWFIVDSIIEDFFIV